VTWERRCVSSLGGPKEEGGVECEGWFQMSNRARLGNGGQGSVDRAGMRRAVDVLQLAAALKGKRLS
jgi:hypothetical protein